MKHDFSFTFTRRFIFDSLKRDMAERTIKGILAVALASYTITGVTRGTEGMTLGLLIWVLFGAVVLCALMTWTLRKSVRRVWELWCTQSPSHQMRFLADDEGLVVTMENAESRYAWRAVQRLRRHRDVWLLEIVKNTSVPFPGREVPAGFRDFVVERCQAAGVKT